MSVDRERLAELVERVRGATGPMSTREVEECIRLSPWYADTALTADPLFWNDFCRALQGSVDAALSFVERVRPGCAFRVQRNLSGTIWAELQRKADDKFDVWNDSGVKPLAMPSFALLTALLLSLQELSNDHH